MSFSLTDLAFPPLVQRLTALSRILDKAQADADQRKYDSNILVQARLAPDMHPLSRQVQIATDFAKGCAARLANIELPRYEDNETTLAELQARIKKPLDLIAAITPEQTADASQRRYKMSLGGFDLDLDGLSYVRDVVFPHFYFHISTAYAILRHNGVVIGKMDYLGLT